ncbi:MAG: hypothetical protein CMM94_00970, partial [Rickettsiales bacterium]|nr:hypothetical protein [Rickettsiales bacterium]
MPRYEITSPDGKRYEINAPEGATQQQALAYARKQFSEPEEEPQNGLDLTSGVLDVIKYGMDNADEGAALLGASQGASANFGDEVLAGVTAAGAYALDKVGFDNLLGGELDRSLGDYYDSALEKNRAAINKAAQDAPAEFITGNLAGAIGTGVAGAGTKAGQAVANSLRSGGVGARLAKSAAAGSASGAVYGAGAGEGVGRLESAAEGAALGGVFGGGASVAGSTLRGVKSAIIPQADDAIRPLARRAKEFGIPLRVDQVAPSRARKTVQKVSQELPLSGADGFEDMQRKAFTKAVARTIGQDSDDLSAATVQSFLKDAERKFGALAKDRKVRVPPSVGERLNKILNDAEETLTGDLFSVVSKNTQKVKDDLSDAFINGKKLASLRSELVKRLPRIQGGAKEYVGELVDTLDDVLAEALPKNQRKILQDARREWRNFKTIEPLLEKSQDGQINPTQLLNRVASNKFIRASRSGVGDDDLVDLARIGKAFLPKAGGSDTYQKLALAGGSGGLGALALTNPGLAAVAAGKGALALGANRAFQRGYNSSQRVVDSVVNNMGSPAGANAAQALPAIGAAQELRLSNRALKQVGDYKQVRTQALRDLKGVVVENPNFERPIKFNRKGVAHSIRPETSKAQLATATQLRSLMETAEYVGARPSLKENPNVKQYHEFTNSIVIGGAPYRVKLMVRETNNGDFFYDYHVTEKQEEPGFTSGASQK